MTSRRNREILIPGPEEKAVFIRHNFGEIADEYDRFNDLATFGIHRIWKKKTALATGLAMQRGVTVLDLCSGSGDIALHLKNILGTDSRIIAVDFSAQMLSHLRERLGIQNGIAVETVEMDVSRLTFAGSSSIDAITMGFGLRNLANRAESLSEIFRVLKPGALFVNLDIGHVHPPLIEKIHQFYFERYIPLLGQFLHGEPHRMYEYLPHSIKTFPDQSALKIELERSGFIDVFYQNFLFGTVALHVAKKPERAV
jgi:demethylmenaquinone methyltransferase/2-methoxy-6-polyprenyl-1,4-benzoquinol methylase